MFLVADLIYIHRRDSGRAHTYIYISRAATINVLARQTQRSFARALSRNIKTPIKQPRRLGN